MNMWATQSCLLGSVVYVTMVSFTLTFWCQASSREEVKEISSDIDEKLPVKRNNFYMDLGKGL